MKIFATLRIALRALRRNTLRTVLTMLGIIIGVAAVIAMVGIGTGAKAMVEAQIAAMGQNVILIFSGSVTRSGVYTGYGGAGTLSVEDAQAIEREVPGAVAVSPEVRTGGQIAYGNQNWFSQILGESPEYLEIRQWKIKDGAMFTDLDVKSANKVCLIGQTTVRQIFQDEDPVGKILRIKNVPLKVIGTLEVKGFSVMGSDQDDVVIMPYTTAMKRIAGTTTLRGMNVQAANPAAIEQAQNQITALLRQRHRIQPGRDDDFMVRTQQEIAERATETSKVMTGLLAAIASISLLVGGIGIMNIMLVSVTERTREIGIRMAVGAHAKDILMQFLIEAVTLSSIGGALGILLGVFGARALQATKGWPVEISPESVVIAFVFSAVVGIFFGFYPARKASRLDPIDALRYE